MRTDTQIDNRLKTIADSIWIYVRNNAASLDSERATTLIAMAIQEAVDDLRKEIRDARKEVSETKAIGRGILKENEALTEHLEQTKEALESSKRKVRLLEKRIDSE